MSYADLYLTNSPKIISPTDDSEPAATLFGIPFDSTHSYKPGCRFGPDAIRDAFNNIEIFMPEFGVDLEQSNIKDLGNLQHTVVAQNMIDMVRKTTTELKESSNQLIILGGEYSLIYGSYMSYPKDTGYVVFDAHYDLRDEFADKKLSHAAYLRRIVEERGPENIIHVGARAFVKEELEFLTENNIKTISDSDIRNGNGPKLLEKMTDKFENLYVSIDLDVLDPAFAPGVGNPEAIGITSRELYDLVVALKNKKIKAADIVELNPSFDNGSTASLAARMISIMISMNLEWGSILLNNLRDSLKPILQKIGKSFASTGLSPNTFTGIGLVLAFVTSILYGISFEYSLIFGGIALLASGFFDIVDGQVARYTNKISKSGCFLDSIFDKIAEVAIFFGILIGNYTEPYLVFTAITLSLLVSFARVKADAAGIKMQGIGIGERAERLLFIAIIGMIGFMEIAVLIVIIITGITLTQRILVLMKNR